MFDWDDNILHMPTPIHMIHNGVSTDVFPSQFAKIRRSTEWVGSDNAYDEFRDVGPRGINAFPEDMKTAIGLKRYGPCWDMFIEVLVNAEIFLIVTARGHSSKILKESVRYIIDTVLTQEQKLTMTHNIMYLLGLFKDNKVSQDMLIEVYLNYCVFMGIYSDDFEKEYGYVPKENNPEYSKELVIKSFINLINQDNQKLGYKITVGFSDDDKGNIKQIKNFLKHSEWESVIGMYIYDTSNPKKIKKTTLLDG
jgi:hypothetical protein